MIPDLAGATIHDLMLRRTGRIIAVDADSLMVLVSWRPGQATQLHPDQLRAGRYQVTAP